MLRELRVRNLAVIEDVRLPLGPGLNVLSGETGAGKSILVDALALLVGERATGDLVRPGAGTATVEAAFELDGHDSIVGVAQEAGITMDDETLVVRRDINREGRNRAWANGSPSTVSVLSNLGQQLVDIHGQHEAQSLLRAQAQRDILDAFAGATNERKHLREVFERVSDLRSRIESIRERRDEVVKRADYLRHVVKEIEDVDPKAGEEDALAVEAKRLNNVETLTRLAESVAEALDGDNEIAVGRILNDVRKSLEQIQSIDSTAQQWRDVIEAVASQVDDIAREVRDYASDVEVDPGRLEEVERRRDQLYKLMQKYGSTVEAIAQTGEEARTELDLLDTADLDLDSLTEELHSAESEMHDAASALTAKRREAAHRLADAVTEWLPELGMPGARFKPAIEPKGEISSTGSDSINFLVQLNTGMDPKPLKQVASGGELSRIMLALKVVLAEHDVVRTLVFDEVDQGVGGETGGKIAEALARVAVSRQVLVVTHLPQIAARADHHVFVAKGDFEGIATASARVLDPDQRVVEVARMLGSSDDPALRV
ncbi:MAG: DNA repair protein RecN, partial [Gemmatimonadota bacterium]|nr:DNA repair protein RecN [Gemmatimonadota bacterium]